MKPEDQRIAIAKHFNWTPPHEPATLVGWLRRTHDGTDAVCMLSDPLTDLDCVFEMESSLNLEMQFDYAQQLSRCVPTMKSRLFGLVHATAAQRVEALLKTLGLWTSSPLPAWGSFLSEQLFKWKNGELELGCKEMAMHVRNIVRDDGLRGNYIG